MSKIYSIVRLSSDYRMCLVQVHPELTILYCDYDEILRKERVLGRAASDWDDVFVTIPERFFTELMHPNSFQKFGSGIFPGQNFESLNDVWGWLSLKIREHEDVGLFSEANRATKPSPKSTPSPERPSASTSPNDQRKKTAQDEQMEKLLEEAIKLLGGALGKLVLQLGLSVLTIRIKDTVEKPSDKESCDHIVANLEFFKIKAKKAGVDLDTQITELQNHYRYTEPAKPAGTTSSGAASSDVH